MRYVKSFVVGNKNDFNDAAEIYDAVTRAIAAKTVAQQDIQSLHTMCKGLTDNRTALTNQIRVLLSERSIIVNQSIAQVRRLR